MNLPFGANKGQTGCSNDTRSILNNAQSEGHWTKLQTQIHRKLSYSTIKLKKTKVVCWRFLDCSMEQKYTWMEPYFSLICMFLQRRLKWDVLMAANWFLFDFKIKTKSKRSYDNKLLKLSVFAAINMVCGRKK